MDTMDKVVVIPFDSEDGVYKEWHYDPAATDAPDGRAEGNDIVVCDYRFKKAGLSIVSVCADAGAEHGIVTAKTNCFYVLSRGVVHFTFYDADGQPEARTLTLDEAGAVMIPEGARFNYRAERRGGDAILTLVRRI